MNQKVSDKMENDYIWTLASIKRKFLTKEFAKYNIPLTKGIVLLAISDSNSKDNQNNLASLSGLDKYRIAKILHELESESMIDRRENPLNRREKLFSMTTKGETTVKLLIPCMKKWQDISMKNLNLEEKQSLVSILNKVIAAF